ncbi:hypothetical protein [Solibaculum intestinale]|uniref:Lipoprotein SmpA/OmlA domain-containing protein n=1 Tax=Solibaculum intestinale TaxID=3133165 RepID=A0ABV1E4W6_9FIRM
MKKLFAVFLAAVLACSCLAGCSGIGPEGISLEEYEKIDTGMSISQVKKIVGGNGEQIGETKDGQVYTYTYKYQGEKSGYAIIVYKADYTYDHGFNHLGDGVISMENHGLK